MLAAGIGTGLAGLSAIGQGIASAAGLGAVAEDDGIFGKAMVFSVLPETQAIYGLLVAILLLVGVVITSYSIHYTKLYDLRELTAVEKPLRPIV